MEWIGSAHVPLIAILSSTRSSLDLTLRLRTQYEIEPVFETSTVELSISDSNREFYPWAALLDYYAKPSEGK